MTAPAVDLAAWRLHNQTLAGADARSAADVVSRLGAVQAQDYPGAKWAIGLRASHLTDADVDLAFNNGELLRTHMMRPTWHFVTPADIRWMLGLTSPRVHAVNAFYYRQAGIDDRAAARARTIVERALGRQCLTRTELAAKFERAGLPSTGNPLAYIMMRLELDQVVCSGPRRGKQFTYALMDERVPQSEPRSKDDALGAIAMRYFASHGPATARDLAWWSGLTQREVRRGIEIAGAGLSSIEFDGHRCWFAGNPVALRATRSAHLLPNYDEYLIAHKDRGFIPRAVVPAPGQKPPRDLHPHHVIVNGRLAGSWRRLDSATGADVDLYPGVPARHASLVKSAVARYRAFIEDGSGRGLS
ncbi:MAG: winged helix DNA-binding domain-containing protein [Vicinamibacterales bacterium]